MDRAVGLLEWKGIAEGLVATDVLLKTAHVELYQAGPVCPGKYLALFGGEVAAVQSAIAAAKRASEGAVIDELCLARVDPSVFPALAGVTAVEPGGALGIIETFSVAAAVKAADAAAKSASIRLLEVRAARGLGGKALVLYSGEVSAVKAAGEAGARIAAESGLLVDWRVIPAPHPDLWEKLL